VVWSLFFCLFRVLGQEANAFQGCGAAQGTLKFASRFRCAAPNAVVGFAPSSFGEVGKL
jgi:hypothetical protein